MVSAGVASFGAGHICLITGILLDGRGWRSAVISFVILYGFMFLILRPHLDRLERRLLVPGFVYAALLCIMAAMMASWGIHAGSIQGIIGGAGGIFFVISDTILGWSHLSGKRTRWHSARTSDTLLSGCIFSGGQSVLKRAFISSDKVEGQWRICFNRTDTFSTSTIFRFMVSVLFVRSRSKSS